MTFCCTVGAFSLSTNVRRVVSKSENSGKVKEFIFNQGKERYFEKSEKIWENIELLWFHFKAVAFSIFNNINIFNIQ